MVRSMCSANTGPRRVQCHHSGVPGAVFCEAGCSTITQPEHDAVFCKVCFLQGA